MTNPAIVIFKLIFSYLYILPITFTFILTMQPAQSYDEALPGAAPYAKTLHESLQAALRAKGSNYQPRTEHLLKSGQPKFTNRLIFENSPYLLQHAHNPVDWFAWGEAAFAKARRENKPVFMSIGYSTCHWCHVMERESFDNIEIARLLNEKFVCIKVDREQHPEVDEVYMTAVTIITKRGGWPMSTFLTPDAKPFWGGTYYPPATFSSVLTEISELWQQQRSKLNKQADDIAELVNQATAAKGKAQFVHQTAIQTALSNILASHDNFLGGFGNAPKFPAENWLLFLLEIAQRGNEEALAVAEKSLLAMAQGGIYDQVGGGFHRYSTDANWLTPHFEKMLYNQAHIARAYVLAYQLTGKQFYAVVAKQTLDYVLRDMMVGGFYSATDADSEGAEGQFFVWTPAQIRAVLDKETAELALSLYGVTEAGNFEGKNILNLPVSVDIYAKKHGLSLTQLFDKIAVIQEKLRIARDKREPPLRDDKILTAWNGMMITTLALAADILGEPRYLTAAHRAANFIWAKLKNGDGELWRVYLDNKISIPAHQEDYAYFAEALITLYDSSGENIWLDRAAEIADGMLNLFWDNTSGGFFINRADDTLLIARPKSPADNAIPSGNAVAVRVLAMLAARSGVERYRDKAIASLNAFAAGISEHPSSYAYMLMAADELFRGEVGMRQYGARGAVKATLFRDEQAVMVELNIRDGWHINAHKPLQDKLIPTVVSLDESQKGWQLGTIEYPKPEHHRLAFAQATLALYQGTIHLRGKLIPLASKERNNLVSIKVKFQACNDKSCLPPEELIFKTAITTGVIIRD